MQVIDILSFDDPVYDKIFIQLRYLRKLLFGCINRKEYRLLFYKNNNLYITITLMQNDSSNT